MRSVIILAAGGGTRMKSSTPKVLHAVCGKSMLYHVMTTAGELNPDKLVVVLGHEKDEVIKNAGIDGFDVAYQDEQLGTAHAVMQTTDKLGEFEGDVVILYGDTPLVKPQTIEDLIQKRHKENASVSIATTILENPEGYGRIIRSKSGDFDKIIEQKDCDKDQGLVKEVNTGMYCFDSGALFDNLSKVSNDNSQKEYYLTDVVSFLVSEGKKISTALIDAEESIGVNSRKDLALANKVCRDRINESFMLEGVTIIDPEKTYIGLGVRIDPDTTILPGTIIKGSTHIKSNCFIGPNCFIDSSTIEEGARIVSSHVYEATICKSAIVGPFSHIRPGTYVGENSKVGAFTETKKTVVGKNSKVPHLSYIGDAVIGDNVNIGAGTITCNYDGEKKYETVIEDGAFIGSDTMLVAPIKIGKNAVTGAGSVLSQDVPDDSLAVERSDQKNIKGWAKRKRGNS